MNKIFSAKDAIEKAAAIREQHNHKGDIIFTVDGQAFFKADPAINHSTRLAVPKKSGLNASLNLRMIIKSK